MNGLAEEHVLCCAVFMRDGTARARVLHRGSKSECEREQALVSGMVVNLDESVRSAEVFIWPASKWAAFELRARERAA
ncbi:MAG: hypothetical protein JSR67_03850 [Proteobacteria bacterium]|nr:hypothetical protein [Pseudomonadota bacterium]